MKFSDLLELWQYICGNKKVKKYMKPLRERGIDNILVYEILTNGGLLRNAWIPP